MPPITTLPVNQALKSSYCPLSVTTGNASSLSDSEMLVLIKKHCHWVRAAVSCNRMSTAWDYWPKAMTGAVLRGSHNSPYSKPALRQILGSLNFLTSVSMEWTSSSIQGQLQFILVLIFLPQQQGDMHQQTCMGFTLKVPQTWCVSTAYLTHPHCFKLCLLHLHVEVVSSTAPAELAEPDWRTEVQLGHNLERVKQNIPIITTQLNFFLID